MAYVRARWARTDGGRDRLALVVERRSVRGSMVVGCLYVGVEGEGGNEVSSARTSVFDGDLATPRLSPWPLPRLVLPCFSTCDVVSAWNPWRGR